MSSTHSQSTSSRTDWTSSLRDGHYKHDCFFVHHHTSTSTSIITTHLDLSKNSSNLSLCYYHIRQLRFIWPNLRFVNDRLEALQTRALRTILHPMTLPYNTTLAVCEIESLKLRRCNFQQKFCKQICHPGNCLHDLLPPQRDPSVSYRLQHSTVYPVPQFRT